MSCAGVLGLGGRRSRADEIVYGLSQGEPWNCFCHTPCSRQLRVPRQKVWDLAVQSPCSKGAWGDDGSERQPWWEVVSSSVHFPMVLTKGSWVEGIGDGEPRGIGATGLLGMSWCLILSLQEGLDWVNMVPPVEG